MKAFINGYLILILVIIGLFVVGVNQLFATDANGNGVEDSAEQVLANLFCPSLQLCAADQGVAPEPVEIMGTDNWRWNLWGKVWNIVPEQLGEHQTGHLWWCDDEGFQEVPLNWFRYDGISQSISQYL
ncbi:MAG: hypothetical protein A7315_10995 [Candidatus Altiarchaeales archaeon WOR_SM1_79]|nr:MAG: hypothetical protein A7315_10995 [Candidatus Altiarchaeales archaeon WOR_SM1_79]